MADEPTKPTEPTGWTGPAEPIKPKPVPSRGSLSLWNTALSAWAANAVVCSLAAKGEKGEKVRDVLAREIQAHADGLAGEGPSPTVRALADTAALAWFALRFAEGQHGRSIVESKSTYATERHELKRIDHAHRRYLSALKALALVRRLEVPTLSEVRARLLAESRRALPTQAPVMLEAD